MEQPTLFDEQPTKQCCPTCQRPYSLDNDGKVGANHPETSRRAATLPKFGSQRYEVLQILVDRGAHTARSVADILGMSPNQCATRLLELREAGLVTYKTENGSRVEAPTSNHGTGFLQEATLLGILHIKDAIPKG